ncbi:MAG: D-Ala-D-Ala carboxypeptidase family metallohydrolase [Bacteroidia bacterium]|nr:D-Ala-D-Ala carboxypeptidase family metallohydrolase [Bacteroidia bacterium]
MLDNWPELPEFKEFFSSLGLKYFAYYEILTGLGRVNSGVTNEGPPKEIWHNIGPTVIVLDNLREHFGVPITINSAYRSPKYNPLIGGAKTSQHMGFVAIDINVRGIHPTVVADQLLAWQAQDKWFSSPIELKPVDVRVPAGTVPRTDLKTRVKDGKFEFLYKGGVGYYSTFTHMDTRGVKVSWDNRSSDSESRSRSLSLEPVELD